MSILQWLLVQLKKLGITLARASVRGLLLLISALCRAVKKRLHSTSGVTKDSQIVRVVYPLPTDPAEYQASHVITSCSLLPTALHTPYRNSAPSASRSSPDISTVLSTPECYPLHSLSVGHLPATIHHVPPSTSFQDLPSGPPYPGLALGSHMPSTNPSVVDIPVDPPETESPVESPHSSRIFGDSAMSSTALINERYPDIFPGTPLFLCRYDRKVAVPDEPTKFIVPSLTICMDPVASPPGWVVFQHPEGAQYFFHKEKRVFTDANLYDPDALHFMTTQIDLILDFLCAHNVVLQSFMDLVVDEYPFEDGSKGVRYYFVNHQDRCVFWMDETDADLFALTYEINRTVSASRVRHMLEAQYWYHCELYPSSLHLTEELVDELRDIVLHATGDLVTSATSMVSWKVGDLNQMLTLVDGFAKNVGKNAADKINGSSCLVGRFMFSFAQWRVNDLHGEPGARLDSDLSVHNNPRKLKRTLLIKLLNPLLFFRPEVHLVGMQRIAADGLGHLRLWPQFITRLNSEWKEFTTYATILLNANVGFLSIQSVDQGGIATPHRSPAQISSYLSILISIGSIIIGLFLMKENRDRGEYNAVTLTFRRNATLGLEPTAILYSLPYAMLIWSLMLFLAAFSFMWFQESDRLTQVFVAVLEGGIVIFLFWSIFAAWDSEGRHWGWNWLGQRLPSFKVTADAQSTHTDTSGPSRHRRWKRLRSLILHQNPPDPDSDQADFRV